MLLQSCNLQPRDAAAAGTAATAIPPPPSIVIESPGDGDEFAPGNKILVSVRARDSIGVNQVKLFVNGRIARTVSSESLQGDPFMQAVLDYLPQRSDLGNLVLRALAYRGAVVSPPDEVTVVLRESPAQIIASPAQGFGVPYIPNDGICRALVAVGLNFRAGPGTGYRVLSVLTGGTLAQISGRNSAHSWWRLEVNGRAGWVHGDYTSEYGDCSRVPVVAD